MRSIGKNGLLIVEGGGKGPLSRIKIIRDTAELTPLKEGYPDGAASVTVVGTTAYVLEGQLAAIFGPAGQQVVVVTKPFHATSVEMGHP